MVGVTCFMQQSRTRAGIGKVAAVVAAMVMVLAFAWAVSGCASSSAAYVGDWEASEGDALHLAEDQSWSVSLRSGDVYEGDSWTVEETDDGTLQITMTGETGGAEAHGTIDGEEMSMKLAITGFGTMTLQKH